MSTLFPYPGWILDENLRVLPGSGRCPFSPGVSFPSFISSPCVATMSPLDVPLKARKFLWAPLVPEPTEGDKSPVLFVSPNSTEQDKQGTENHCLLYSKTERAWVVERERPECTNKTLQAPDRVYSNSHRNINTNISSAQSLSHVQLFVTP